jgi:hypothetical protein
MIFRDLCYSTLYHIITIDNEGLMGEILNQLNDLQLTFNDDLIREV